MAKKKLILLFFSVLALSSCKKKNTNPTSGDYLIFGHFYGMCMGEKCIEIFKLEKGKLFEDTRDQYPNSDGFYQGNYTLLSNQKFMDAKDLINDFPADLLQETNTVIGQPDAGDWGGLYVEYNFNGVRKFWLLDQMKSNVAVKYHEFIDKVNEKIALLQ